MSYFPIFLKLDEQSKILVVGGGAIALAKLESIYHYAKFVHVVATEFSPEIITFLKENNLTYQQGSYHKDLLTDVKLVIAATNDTATNTHIKEDAKALGILANVVDNPKLCDVIFPAIIRRGALQIAISSSGISPVITRLLKQKIENILPNGLDKLLEFTKNKRSIVKNTLSNFQDRRLFWHRILEGRVAENIYQNNTKTAELLFKQSLHNTQKNTKSNAALYLIGAGPGNPDLLTIKAIRLLSTADIVLYDRLVSAEVLDMYARKEAVKKCVGKTKDLHLSSQESINAQIEEHLQAGKIVVRLKGGDPAMYAHAAEELQIAQKLNVPYQIVPGITAASGCAASAGIPLTERGGAASVQFLTFYDKKLADQDFLNSLQHAHHNTLVFYMASHHRDALCHTLIEQGFAPNTPIMAVEQGTTSEHREYVGTLENFPILYKNRRFLSPTLLIVGDVIRLKSADNWKEQPLEVKEFFKPLIKEVPHAIH